MRWRETEPLIFTSTQLLSIDLATGRTDQGSLQMASWVGEKVQNRFDWRYQLSIPGGGLIECKRQFDFEAPVDGYQTTMEINMPTTVECWSDCTKNNILLNFLTAGMRVF